MRVVDLDQRTDEWKRWRKLGVTATDSPVLFGLVPEQNSIELWAAISQVWWPSCPHEWAFPFLEAHSHPDFSSIGRASISALRATVAPGLLPSIKRNPLPGEVSVSNPEIPNCSRMDLMRASVPRVLKPTSGFSWTVLRKEIKRDSYC